MFNQTPSVDCCIGLGQYFGCLYFDKSFTSWYDKRFHSVAGIVAIRLMVNVNRALLSQGLGRPWSMSTGDWVVQELAFVLGVFN